LEGVRETSDPGAKARSRKIRRWKRDPFHRSLQFEERRNGICVIRVGNNYRALGLRESDTIVWFWIGTHEQYNRFRF
jgi:hypothetical protein